MSGGAASALPDATAIARSVRAGETSARDAVGAALARIEAGDGRLGAFASVDAAGALARADALDARPPAERGPLAGVPVALKSNLCLAGAVSHCGSRMLERYRAPYTATCVERLLAAGAIPVGMTHMDEFAMGSSGENSAFGRTVNPWDAERVPGGSSSGSAAAVAAGLVPLALGSDTGGSVRLPAALCGVVGFKPSYGRISRYGLIAFGSSLDQVAPLARSVRDAELALEALSGHDPRDATSLAAGPVEREGEVEASRLTLGVSDELVPDAVEDDVRRAYEAAVELLADAGAAVRETSLPHATYAVPTYYVVATAEASSNLARYDGVRYGLRTEGDGTLDGMLAATRTAGFGTEVVRRILLGTYALSSGYYEAWYGRAQRVRARIAEDFERAFESVDLVLSPTSPTPAFRRGEKARDPLAMYWQDVLTVPASLAGLPAVSVPCGPPGALPVGLQIVGPPGSDARVLAAARLFQERSGHPAAWPAAGVA